MRAVLLSLSLSLLSLAAVTALPSCSSDYAAETIDAGADAGALPDDAGDPLVEAGADAGASVTCPPGSTVALRRVAGATKSSESAREFGTAAFRYGLGPAWSNLDGTTANDGRFVSTTLNMGENSQFLFGRELGVRVPRGGTIRGLRVEILAASSRGDAVDLAVGVGSDAAWSFAEPEGEERRSIPRGPITVGGEDATWGRTWAADEVETFNFGVVVQARATTPPGPVEAISVDVDELAVTVFVLCP